MFGRKLTNKKMYIQGNEMNEAVLHLRSRFPRISSRGANISNAQRNTDNPIDVLHHNY
jgi:hypothetical protein